MVICIIVGVSLAVVGLMLLAAGNKEEVRKPSNTPPPLPPRRNRVAQAPAAARTQTVTRSYSTPSQLPPRKPSLTQTTNAVQKQRGHRPLKPNQFPCCPYCKERNVVGAPQLIFWDSGRNCYRCSNGHQFKMNGKPL